MYKFSVLCLLAVSFWQSAAGLSVMSVDLGNEFIKIAIVSPGKPMEIILNTDSSRKTPHLVAFRDGERFFGEAALTTGTRFPEKTFSYLLDVIGKSIDSPLVQMFQKRFAYLKMSADDATGSVVFEDPKGNRFTAKNC
ncbi:Hypoxia up-regulated protein 1 [Halotydeus destructor]|nr:Hypoxia up-regulated protein 1 [Halotydeus destructor]